MRKGWAAALAAGFVVAAAPGVAAAPTVKKVKMYDNYYSPAKLTIRPGTAVQWVWPADVGDNHDVKLRKAPGGVKKFKSPPYATAAKWPRPPKVFKKSGTYRFYCTFHETEMTMTIVVKKAS
jgi:plastocyanin